MDPTPSLPDPGRTADEDGFVPSLPSGAPAPSTWPGGAPAGEYPLPPEYDGLGELGRGGMGVVYRARDRRLGRVCAVKLFLPSVPDGDPALDRFRGEARTVARMQHPNVVQVFEVGEHAGRPFMAMEFCPGGSLDARLARSPLPPRGAAAVVECVARAVAEAHAAGVVHRDLKPANVLLAADGSPKVADFGLARRLDEAGVTRSGGVLGTPSYMPPEQAEGREVDPRADVYSLGAVLYECLTGRPPFRAATALETLRQVTALDPVPPRRLNPAVPADLETVALKCLAKSPADRYGTAAELADDIGRFLRGEPILARPVGAGERLLKWVRRNRAVAALAAFAAASLLAGAAAAVGFGLHARGEADRAGRAEADAARDAAAARQEAARANRERDRAELLAYAAGLTLAVRAEGEGDGVTARRHLGACRWDVRGWEHRHLWTRLNSRQVIEPARGKYVCAVAWTPDGSSLLVGGDGTLGLYDAATARLVRSFDPGRGFAACAVSPDGTRVASVTGHGTVRVFDVGGRRLHSPRAGTRATALAWSPEGSRLAVAGDLRAGAVVFGGATGRTLFRLSGHRGAATSVAWSPDGSRLATGGFDEPVKLHDARTGREIGMTAVVERGARSLSFSPDGRRLAASTSDRTVVVFDAATAAEVFRLPPQASNQSALAFSPDGSRLAVGSWDAVVRVRSAADGRELLALRGHTAPVRSVAWSPDGSRLASASEDGTARVWDAERLPGVAVTEAHDGQVMAADWHPDGTRFATGANGTLRVGDAVTGRALLRLDAPTLRVGSLAYSPDGSHLLAGRFDGGVRVLDARTGAVLRVLTPHGDGPACVAWRPDGRRVLSAGDDGVVVHDPDTGNVVRRLLGCKSAVNGVVWSRDGARAAAACKDGTVRVWDGATGRVVLSATPHANQVSTVAFRADGRRLLTAGWDGVAKILDADTGATVLVFRGHTFAVTSATYSPDGSRVLTCGSDKTARVWDAATGRELLSLTGHGVWVTRARWSPDGRRVLTASFDGTARVWDAGRVQAVFPLTGHVRDIDRVAFTADGYGLFARDKAGDVLAWDAVTGRLADASDPPDLDVAGAEAVSPNGALRASVLRADVLVADTRLADADGNAWPPASADERRAYHAAKADDAAKAGDHYAEAFHVSRLLLDVPGDAGLVKRRDDARRRHAAGR